MIEPVHSVSETKTEANQMISHVFKLVFLGFYLGSVFSIFYPSIFLIGQFFFNIPVSMFLHIIKSSVYTAIIFQPECLYFSSLFQCLLIDSTVLQSFSKQKHKKNIYILLIFFFISRILITN